MALPISLLGVRVSPITQQELSSERAAARKVQAQAVESKPDPVLLQSAVGELEQISLAFNKKLKFMVDHESKEVTVKVIDPETDKVIKILPPEELQRLHSKIRETIGFLFDQRV